MRKPLKKMIEEKLEHLIIERGFKYNEDLSNSRTGIYTYVKFQGQELEPGWVKKHKAFPLLEYIRICRSTVEKRITVDLFSNIDGGPNIERLRDLDDNKSPNDWWLIQTDEQTETAFEEIKNYLEKYAWNWFKLE